MNPLVLAAGQGQPAWLARRDPRLRVLAALTFAVLTVSLHRLPVLVCALAAAIATALAAGLAPPMLLRRLMALEGFMAVVLLSLPFTVPGEPMAVLGGTLTASWDGLWRAAAIVLKANAIVVMLLALTGTLDPVVLGHTLARLKVPDKLVHLFLFTVRYIGVMYDEYRKMRLALRARAFRAGTNRHTWRTFGWLVGMLLVRSLERSRRVLAAMKCRGFRGRFHLLHQGHWGPMDSAASLLVALLLGALLALEHLG